MANIDNLVEELGKLTVIEAGELAKKLEKTWGLDLNAIMSTPAPVEEVKEESLFKITLTGFDPDKKISVIKAIRAFKDMGLLEAKNFVEGCPSIIAEDQAKDEADKIKADIESAGGKIEVK
jgi:large subunit ribosomal protein L7/L12